MTIFVFPNNLCPKSFGMQLMGNVKVNASVINGANRRVEYPGDRWIIRAEFPPVKNKKEWRRIHAFFNQFRGGLANTLRIWPLDHPRPGGTISGSPVLADSAVYGSNMINVEVDEQTHTILMGDMLGVTLNDGSTQLIQVTSDPIPFTGGLYRSFSITPPLRRPATSQSAIIWDKPSINCVLTSHPFPTTIIGFGEGFTFEAQETFLV